MSEALSPDRCIVRDTASRKGRTRSVAPESTSARYLHYGRIVLDPGDAPPSFATGEHETGRVCLKGNWTPSPPHEHAALAEEAYVYIDMPPPSWGVQFVYTDPKSPELAVVREGDCVLIPEGYHPNVAAPGGTINFLWMMAAHREREDRLFGAVNVQPEYTAGGSGIEAGAKR